MSKTLDPGSGWTGVALQDALKKIDIPIDGDLAGLLQQRATAAQDIPQAASDLPLFLILCLGVSWFAAPVRNLLHSRGKQTRFNRRILKILHVFEIMHDTH